MPVSGGTDVAKFHFSKNFDAPCVECHHVGHHIILGGKRLPAQGDKTLCMRCGSLNVLDDNLMFRAPTVDEFLDVAKDADAQRIRREILSFKPQAREGKRA